jgi:hypothetical protein
VGALFVHLLAILDSLHAVAASFVVPYLWHHASLRCSILLRRLYPLGQVHSSGTVMLLDLPGSLAANILCIWLQPATLARLDAAYCCKSLRSVFIDLLHAPGLVLKECNSAGCGELESWLKWHTTRKLKASRIMLPREICNVSLLTVATFLATVGGKHVATVVIEKTVGDLQALFAMMMMNCVAVQSFSASDCTSLSGLRDIMQCWSHSLQSIILAQSEMEIIADLDGLRLPCLSKVILSGSYSAPFVSGLLRSAGALSFVRLYYAGTDSTALQALSTHAERLTWLCLWGCVGVDPSELVVVARGCRALQGLELQFSGPEGQNDAAVEAFVAAAPHLDAVALGGNFTQAALHAVATHCGSRLRHFYIEELEDFTDASRETLAEKCTTLETLGIRECWDATDANAVRKRLIAAQKGLRCLDLVSTDIDDGYFDSIAKHCLHLEVLLLHSTTGYMAAGVLRLINACPRIRHVSIENDHSIINNLVRLLWQRDRPRLKFTHESEQMKIWDYDLY